MKTGPKVLIYGFGNPGRGDDNLGPQLVSDFEERLNDVSFASSYQLNIEDALTVSLYDLVIFVDALKNSEEKFSFKKVIPHAGAPFSTHALSVNGVVALAQELYQTSAQVYLLAVSGYKWDFGSDLSTPARNNLQLAQTFLLNNLERLKEELSEKSQCR